MDVKSYLKDYVNETTPIIREFLNEEINQAKRVSPITADMLQRYKGLMEGGKRLRGAQIVLGYEMFGGKDKKAIVKASTAIEIIHAFLLMHDDIMDEDDLRRGQPTLHKQFEKLHQKNFKKRNSSHYGLSMAINTGDIGMFLASKLLSTLPFPAKYLIEVYRFINQLLIEVGFGQALDITYESFDNLTVDDVLRVHRYKAADYTVSGPLIIGGLLTGKKPEQLKSLYKYGLPVGIAFQLRDDELGMFSSSEILGKPVDSDIREGKNTLLALYSLEKATAKDRKFLKWAHGNNKLTKKDVERFRQIVVSTGALKYSQDLSKKLVEEGKSYITKITDDPYYRQMLAKLANFMIEREN